MKLLLGFPAFPPTTTDNRTISSYVEDEQASLPAGRCLSLPGNGSSYQAGGRHSCSAQPPAEENRKMERYSQATSGNHPSSVSVCPPDAPVAAQTSSRIPDGQNAPNLPSTQPTIVLSDLFRGGRRPLGSSGGVMESSHRSCDSAAAASQPSTAEISSARAFKREAKRGGGVRKAEMRGEIGVWGFLL